MLWSILLRSLFYVREHKGCESEEEKISPTTTISTFSPPSQTPRIGKNWIDQHLLIFSMTVALRLSNTRQKSNHHLHLGKGFTFFTFDVGVQVSQTTRKGGGGGRDGLMKGRLLCHISINLEHQRSPVVAKDRVPGLRHWSSWKERKCCRKKKEDPNYKL